MVDVEKSPNDKLDYRLLQFDSGFEALLISTTDAQKHKAAASMAAAVGSFSDPQGRCEGLAHYLEHMLFMGSAKYPGEDEMEEFLSKHGGCSNAYTEAAHTCYYFEINKAELHKALDIFAQLFVAPLMKVETADREINAIDSEFRLTQNSDGSRVEQLFASFARAGHPYRTFGWGNLASLSESTKKAGVDLNEELRKFYSTHYRAPRLRLCVYGVEPLDSIEAAVRASFAGLPVAAPTEPERGPQEATLAAAGAPFEEHALPIVLRVRPVKDTHKLSLSWQLPPTQHMYKSKPVNYLQHLIGHEGAGSLLSFLKKKGLATQLSAGVSDDSFESNSMCCIFNIEVTLTKTGLEAWPDVAHAAVLYLEMLRREGPQEWVHKEMTAVEDMGWRFLEETNPADQVQTLACQMLPVYRVEPEHVLRASWMLPQWDPETVLTLLSHMKPERLMLHILSSAYGRAQGVASANDEAGKGEDEDVGKEADEEADDENEDEEEEEEEEEEDDEQETGAQETSDSANGTQARDPFFDLERAGTPAVEPLFGTEYWPALAAEIQELVDRLKAASMPGSFAAEAAAALRMPDRNIFLASDFGLRQAPVDVATAKSAWIPQEPLQKIYKSFPPMPSPLPRQPQRLTGADAWGVRAWHLQDTVFMTPRSEIWLKLATDELPLQPRSARAQVVGTLLSRALSDTLNETAYLADQASLHIRIASQNYGLDVKVGGFHDKLPLLLEAGLKELLAFGDANAWAGRFKDEGFIARLEAQREQLLRGYRNAYLKPGDHAADLRRLLLMPQKQAPAERASALEALTLEDLATYAQELLPKLHAEVLLTGNITSSDAEAVVRGLPAAFHKVGESMHGSPRHPQLPTAVVPAGAPTIWVEESPDTKNPNVAVEMYWQLEASTDPRPRVVLDVLEALMEEPLFDALRTKQQIGYVASCGMRYTQGVLGFSIWLLSSKVLPSEICRRVEAYLPEFRQRVVDMSAEDVERHVSSLAGHKLEPHRTLLSVQESAWSELQERTSVFDRSLQEAAALASVDRKDVLRILDDFILPGAAGRRMVVVSVIGGAVKTNCSAELEGLRVDYPGARVVSSQAEFLAGTTLHEGLV